MPQYPRVLIVVPCLNEQATLSRLLSWLVDRAGDDRLVVVVDGGSTDGSLAIAEGFAERHSCVKLLHNPKRLQSAGVNLAVDAYGDDRTWLLRIDAHCAYPDDYAEILLQAAEATGATSVVVPMITQGHACFQTAVAAAQNSILGTGGSPHRHLVSGRYVDHGHHALMQLAFYRAVGGYDETFSHNEDAELDRRLTAAGATIWLEPQASLIYWPRKSARALFRQYYSYGRGRARTVLKHRIQPKLRQLGPLIVLPALLSAAFGSALSILSPWFSALISPAIIWFATCQLFAIVLAGRRRSFCVLASGWAAMVMHIAWSAGFWAQLAKRRQLVADATDK